MSEPTGDALMDLVAGAEEAVGLDILRRVTERIARSVERDLIPAPPSDTEHLKAELKRAAGYLDFSGQVLQAAANRFKKANDRPGAQRTQDAADVTLERAAMLMGE
jgi:hypothetical protein